MHKKLHSRFLSRHSPKVNFVKAVLKIFLKADLWPAMLVLFEIYLDLQMIKLHNVVIISNYELQCCKLSILNTQDTTLSI